VCIHEALRSYTPLLSFLLQRGVSGLPTLLTTLGARLCSLPSFPAMPPASDAAQMEMLRQQVAALLGALQLHGIAVPDLVPTSAMASSGLEAQGSSGGGRGGAKAEAKAQVVGKGRGAAKAKAKAQGGGNHGTGSQAKAEGWCVVTAKKKEKKKPDEKEVPAGTVAKKDTLLAEGWSVPVVGSVAELGVSTAGVALATFKEAEEAVVELAQATQPVAILAPKPVNGNGVQVQVPVQDKAGKLQLRMRYLVQCGVAERSVAFKLQGGAQADVAGDTVRVVLLMCQDVTDTELWKAALLSPQDVTRRWLEAAGFQHLGVRSPERFEKGGASWLQLIARISLTDFSKALQISGKNGVFTRAFFTSDEDREAHKMVRLPVGTDRAGAQRQAERVSPHALGVVFNGSRWFVRVPKDKFADTVRLLFGEEEASKTEGTIFEISDVPDSWGRPALEGALLQWGWQAEIVRPAEEAWGRRRWIVRSNAPPVTCILRHASGLCRVSEASARGHQQQQQQQQQQQPRTRQIFKGKGRGSANSCSHLWPALAAPAAKAEDRGAKRALGEETETMQVDRSVAAEGGASQAAKQLPPQPPDMAALIAAAMQQFVAPMVTQMTSLQTELTAMKAQMAPVDDGYGMGGEDGECSLPALAVPPSTVDTMKGKGGRGVSPY
jgi:hypothetical protein